MTAKDLPKFAVLWNQLYESYGVKASDNQVRTAFQVMLDFEFCQIKQAIAYLLRTSHFLPRIADVVDVIKGKNSETKSLLEAQALQAYNKILRGIAGGGYDLVIADDKACYALCVAFGSAKALASRPDNDYANVKDKESFVKAYVAAPDSPSDITHVFDGYKGTDGSPLVRFIGDWNICKKLADEYYAKQGVNPRYPENPETVKPLVRAQAFIKEQAASSQEIGNFIEELKKMITA